MTDLALLSGIYWTDLDGIRARHAAGADVNAVDANGRTPLTEAILGGTGYPAVVKLLLELHADPSVEDANGYTPWLAYRSMAGNPVTERAQSRIRALLEAHGASRAGEAVFELQARAGAGDIAAVRGLLEQGVRIETPFCSPLGAALFEGHPQIAELLLQSGANPEGCEPQAAGLSPLMHAADMGLLPMVQLLVQYGADVTRAADGEDGCMTAAWYARQKGHHDVADWLAQQHPAAERCRIPQSALGDGPKAKYLALYRCYTNGRNHGLDTDAIVRQLSAWDKRHGIQVQDVATDRVTVQFIDLPDDVGKLVKEIDKLCPDVIGQHFGLLDEHAAQFTVAGQAVPADLAALLQDLDPGHRQFGQQVLGRWLRTHRAVQLWWD
ncbi:ankyrin repeat domain-containing protein [Chitiniphilus purpureus]|uniref:Ankyrin repeat domain-containing protein n=1 Tax=Chitiniphilus purpureus TaxID=2981137 RepID=A0ABY6DPB9_9NEIS|nr:ankyrin repeat domain-containing protein [Chitiniphilus sp. CD1]UXY16204.1 ankyrin repeat domain-containing protein [Chitiniphilus sp. CD1]